MDMQSQASKSVIGASCRGVSKEQTSKCKNIEDALALIFNFLTYTFFEKLTTLPMYDWKRNDFAS